MRAVKILTDPRAGVRLKASSVTVSTVGLVPEIERFCRDAGNGASLAISLHAVTDDVRDKASPRARLTLCFPALVFRRSRESSAVLSGHTFNFFFSR